MKKIKIAIAGCGSCASSLVQGIQYYINNPDDQVGLTYQEIGGYSAKDIEFVVGFDIDVRKTRTNLADALFQYPNNVMRTVGNLKDVVAWNAKVYRGPTLDGFPPHMKNQPENITFLEDTDIKPITAFEYRKILVDLDVDILLNYMPVGSEEASKFYIENAMFEGVHIVNCMPSYIDTKSAQNLEKMAIDSDVCIIGSDMRSAFGASRLSEILQGNMLDSGLMITQHIQTNRNGGSTQGQENIRTGRSSNTDFLNMAEQYRLKNKHISKENVLKGQNAVRNVDDAGTTMFAGPALTIMQKPGGEYLSSDMKIANIDIIAFGWAGARYNLTARLEVQDSPNSGAIVFDAIRFLKVASELGVVGYLRGPSAWTQKTPPLQMKTADSKFECDALARRMITPLVEKQLAINNPKVENLNFTFQKSSTDYE